MLDVCTLVCLLSIVQAAMPINLSITHSTASPLPTGLSALISMLPSSEHVKAAYLGSDGILTVEPGQLHPHLLVDCSTIDPITSQEVSVWGGWTVWAVQPVSAPAPG